MRLRNLLITIVCHPIVCIAAEPLAIERLTQIVTMEHEDKLDDPALKIYPKAREYQITITSVQADGQTGTGKATATEKWVGGRYIVSEGQPLGPDTKFAMIVEYDRESRRYRKYLLTAGKLAGFQEGIRVGDSRSVAWIDLSSGKFPAGIDGLSTETHTDSSTTWSSVFYVKGQFKRSETGVAKVTKP